MGAIEVERLAASEPATLVGRLEAAWERGRAALVHDPRDDPPEIAAPPPGTALILATAGTTGRPKLVALSHDAVATAVDLTNEAVGAGPGDRWLCCLPPHHIGGLMTLLRSRALGTDAVVHESFDLERFSAERAARFVSVVPTMLYRVVEAGMDLTHFQRVLVGGAGADRALLERVHGAVTTTYGMTETCGGVVYDGRTLPGVDVRIVNGRVALRTPTVMTGYVGDPAGTRASLVDGWFITNDAGVVEGDGSLRVLGRIDEVIVVGGRKVDPAEVAAALREHHSIADALVRGEPDTEWGQRVVALVVAVDPERPPALEELHDLLEGRLSPHKWPRRLAVVDRLPKS